MTKAHNKQEHGEPAQEPLFWYKPYPNGMYNGPIHNAQIGDILRGSEEWVPLYTTPQQLTWVGLTDEDRQQAFESMPDMLEGFLKKWGWLHFSKAIEAKLKAKNGIKE